jgi:hypothetical protein
LIESRSTTGSPRHAARFSKETMLPQYYLIVGYGSKGVELPHILSDAGKEILPVFSTKTAAQGFLSLSLLGEGWDVRGFSGGELVSMLFAFRARIKGVALNPQPATLSEDVALYVVGRNAFVGSLLETRSHLTAIGARS